jgi:hypothetical protein
MEIDTKMKKLLKVLLIVCLILCACKKDCPDKHYSLWINIVNQTDYKIEVELFPKQEYLSGGNLYRMGSYGGGYKDRVFTLDYDSAPHPYANGSTLYFTHDTASTPSDLLKKVFDSIFISLYDDSNTLIKLFHNHTVNYSENPYNSDSIWIFEIAQREFPDNDCMNPAEIKDYTYLIKQEKVEN